MGGARVRYGPRPERRLVQGQIDQHRIREILAGSYSYYSKDACTYETIGPLTPDTDDLLAKTLTKSMTVLDVGCGDGRTLLRHASAFGRGVGIDENQGVIDAAKAARHRAGHRERDVRKVLHPLSIAGGRH